MKKRFRLVLIVGVIGTFVLCVVVTAMESVWSREAMSSVYGEKKAERDNWVSRIFTQGRVLDEARRFEKEHKYEEAIGKYYEALKPEYLTSEGSKSGPMGGLRRAYMMQEQYEKAQKALQWFIEDSKPRIKPGEEPGWMDHKLELDALLEHQRTGNPEPVRAHIRHLREKYQKILPPEKWTTYSNTIISTLLRLYDHIGDSDEGIKFIDTINIYFYGKLEHYRGGKSETEFLKLRKAFEEEKQNGTHGKVEKLIIESDYFAY